MVGELKTKPTTSTEIEEVFANIHLEKASKKLGVFFLKNLKKYKKVLDNDILFLYNIVVN